MRIDRLQSLLPGEQNHKVSAVKRLLVRSSITLLKMQSDPPLATRFQRFTREVSLIIIVRILRRRCQACQSIPDLGRKFLGNLQCLWQVVTAIVGDFEEPHRTIFQVNEVYALGSACHLPKLVSIERPIVIFLNCAAGPKREGQLSFYDLYHLGKYLHKPVRLPEFLVQYRNRIDVFQFVALGELYVIAIALQREESVPYIFELALQ